MNKDYFMQRALFLAKKGEGHVSPNPMVGAVIVCHGKIIGEGFHAVYGGPHAEVNAIKSVSPENLPLLKQSTIFVTLEPCAHYGKTPPCANLIVTTGIPEVVIGSLDPNPKVSGKGIKILEDAGIKVTKGILKKECDDLNSRFMKFHTGSRPWIILKWAMSSDKFMATLDDNGNPIPVKISNPLSLILVHKERSKTDAIAVGTNTLRIDKPRLDNRLWGGNSPRRIVVEQHIECWELVNNLAKEGVTSLMVEGGPTFLRSFIKEGLYDEIRVEISPKLLGKGLKAPIIPDDLRIDGITDIRGNEIITFRR